MTVRVAIRDWLAIILLGGLICLVALIVVWGVISIYANIAENDNPYALPKFPDIKKAQFTVYFKATGAVLLTNEYDHPTDNFYILHGYYEMVDNKWRWRDIELPLDEEYFGEITVKRRDG